MMRLPASNIDKYNSLIPLIAIMYALYAIKCVWLAFAHIEYSAVFYYIMFFPVGACLPLGLLAVINKSIDLHQSKWLYILPFIYFAYNLFNTYQDLDFINDLFTLTVVELFVVFNSELKLKIFNVFYWIIQALNIVSILYFICHLLNFNFGVEIVPYYSGINANYIKWFIFAIYQSRTELRLCGIFNEPGALGTVCALLFAARFTNSRFLEKLLLVITVVLTFSLAGYLIIFIYLSLYLIKKDKKNIVFVLCLLLLFLALPYVDWQDASLKAFMSRFAITSHGLAGDNRTTDTFDIIYSTFCNSDYRWFGYGQNYPLPPNNSSYKCLIIEYGFIGFCSWLAVWIKSALDVSKKNKYYLLFLLCFLISLYQRPRLIESIYGYVLLFGGIQYINSNTTIKSPEICESILA